MMNLNIQEINKHLQDQLSISEAELKMKNKKIQNLQNDLSLIQNHYEELLTNVTQYQVEHTNISKQNATLKQKVKAQADLIQNLQNQLSKPSIKEDHIDAQKKLQELTVRVAAQAEENSQLQKIIKDLTQTNQKNETQYNNKISKMKKEHDSKILEMEKKLKFFQEENQNLQEQLIQTQDENNAIKKSAKQLFKDSKKEILKLQKKLETFSNVFEHIFTLVLPHESKRDPEHLIQALETKFASSDLSNQSTSSLDSNNERNNLKMHRKSENHKIIQQDPKKFKRIEDQFQTDFSLESIIKMHNQLSHQENIQNQQYIRY